jgi:putative DNA primase/helicase
MRNIYVLDADEGLTPEGLPKDGIKNLIAAIDNCGVNLDDTFQVNTPSCGKHYVYSLPEGVDLRNTQSVIAPHVDTRGTGGMIVWAGSVRSDGRIYQPANDKPIQPMPPSLVEFLKQERQKKKAEEFKGVWNGEIPSSRRNSTLTSIGGGMRRNGVEPAVIALSLQLINEQYSKPPLSKEEVGVIAQSLGRYNPTYSDTATGNAERFRDQNKNHVLYCSELNSWLIWDGKRFQRDTTLSIQEPAKQVGYVLRVEAEALPDTTVEEQKIKTGKALFAKQTLDNPLKFLQLAKSDPVIAVKAEDLDRHLYQLNCQNGVLDLKTGTLKQHSPEYRWTKIVPASFDPAAACPTFEQSLRYWFNDDQQMIDFMAQLVGMGLTGDTSEQKLVKMLGNGKNGKSVLADMVAYLAGDYASVTRPEVFLINAKGSNHNYIAEMRGCRFVFASEFPQGSKVNTALLKEFSGGEKIKGRQLYQESITFRPEFLLMTTTNWPWIVEGEDGAILRRMVIVPFDRVIPEELRDRNLIDKLKSEVDGILAWAVRGCLDWQRNGLRVPQKVTEQLDMYATNMDMFGAFVDERLTVDATAEIQASELHSAFNNWLEGKKEERVSQKVFGSIASRKFKPVRRKSGVFYVGVKLAKMTFGR